MSCCVNDISIFMPLVEGENDLGRENMVRTFDDFIRRIKRANNPRLQRLMRQFTELAHNHPDVLQAVVTGVDARLAGRKAASVAEVVGRVMWDSDCPINEHLTALIARALLWVRPDLNGFVEVRRSRLFDDLLGCYVADKRLPGYYAPRLVWPSETADMGFDSLTSRKLVQSVRSAQGELFAEVV